MFSEFVEESSIVAGLVNVATSMPGSLLLLLSRISTSGKSLAFEESTDSVTCDRVYPPLLDPVVKPWATT